MPNQWFRMYHEFATDPKVQMLSEANQRRFVMLLCLRCSNEEVTLHDEEVAFQLRISNDEYQETKQVLMERGLIDEENNPTAWEKRQFVSDSSAARVARHRAKKKQKRNVTVTPPDTDTDSDTESENSKGVSVDTPEKSPPKKSKNYPDWFESLWSAYPPRAGSNDKRRAFQAANARLKEGKALEDLQAAVFRYSRFINVTGKQHTEFVKQAATFFGPGEHIDNPWRIPDATTQQRAAGGQSGSHAERVRAQAKKDLERRHGQHRDHGHGESAVHEDERPVPEQGSPGRVVDIR